MDEPWRHYARGKKTNTVGFHLHKVRQVVRIVEEESIKEEKRAHLFFNECEVSILQDEKSYRDGGGEGYTSLIRLNLTLEND